MSFCAEFYHVNETPSSRMWVSVYIFRVPDQQKVWLWKGYEKECHMPHPQPNFALSGAL